MKIHLFIDPKYSNIRLDLAITLNQKELSRSLIKRLIANGNISLNGSIEYRPQIRVSSGDEIDISYEQVKEDKNILAQNIPLDIIYEDDDLIVVNKPYGMVTHPATSNWEGTLVNALLFHYKDLKNIGQRVRSGLIHRLDKDTSGLVLIGKSNKGLWHYSRLFAERKVDKRYLAVICGNIEKISSTVYIIKNYIGRNPKNRKKMSIIDPTLGRYSESEVRLLKKSFNKDYGNIALVEVRPKTGRTHQIRLHLSSIGCPILGDKVYGHFKGAERMFLHAWKIKILCTDNIEREFVAPLPNSFNNLIDAKSVN